ncbi:uncharacterized protein LOC115159679 [Salmo trutta]|uniref:uncharacterized protein LOC115159679 n=1 Tax=Salmo trutta TaxID=8032 RepID=UPI001131B3E0|nr:uncharacterized protein LOC115159679 [Salmo trutta]
MHRGVNLGFSHPVTHIVSGVAPVEHELTWNTMGVRPSVAWIAYHHTTTTGQTFHGAMVQKAQGARGWVQHTLVQLQEILAERYSTAEPVRIFPSRPEPQRLKPSVIILGEQGKTGIHRQTHKEAKQLSLESQSSPKKKSGVKIDASVQMDFDGPYSLDERLIKQQDVFQVDILHTEGSSKGRPDVELVVIAEIPDVSPEVPTPERPRATAPLTTLTTSSLNSVERILWFNAVSDGDDTKYKLTNGFIGLLRKNRDFLSKPQREVQPALVRRSQDKNGERVDNKGQTDHPKEPSGAEEEDGASESLISTTISQTVGETINDQEPTLMTEPTESTDEPSATTDSLQTERTEETESAMTEMVDEQEFPSTLPTPTTESLQTKFIDETETVNTNGGNDPEEPESTSESLISTTISQTVGETINDQEPTLMTEPTESTDEPSPTTDSLQTECTEETESAMTEMVDEQEFPSTLPTPTTESLQTKFIDETETVNTNGGNDPEEPESTSESLMSTTISQTVGETINNQEPTLMTEPTESTDEPSATTDSLQTERTGETESAMIEMVDEQEFPSTLPTPTTESLQTRFTDETETVNTNGGNNPEEPESTSESLISTTISQTVGETINDQEPTLMTEPTESIDEPSATTDSLQTERTEETESAMTEMVDEHEFPSTLPTPTTESLQIKFIDETETVNTNGGNDPEEPESTSESLISTTISQTVGETINDQEPTLMTEPTESTDEPSATTDSLQTERTGETESAMIEMVDEQEFPTTLPTPTTESLQTRFTDETETVNTNGGNDPEEPESTSESLISTTISQTVGETINDQEPTLMTEPTESTDEPSATTDSLQTECTDETENPPTERIDELRPTDGSPETEITENRTENVEEPTTPVEETDNPTTENVEEPSPTIEESTAHDKHIPTTFSPETENPPTKTTQETGNQLTESVHVSLHIPKILKTEHETDFPVLPVCKGLVHRTDAAISHCRERMSLTPGKRSNETSASYDVSRELLYITITPETTDPSSESLTICENETEDRDPSSDDSNLSYPSSKDEHFYYSNGKLKRIRNNINPKEYATDTAPGEVTEAPETTGPESITIPVDETEDGGPSEISQTDGEEHHKEHESIIDINNPSSDDNDEHFYYFNGKQKKVRNNFYPKVDDMLNTHHSHSSKIAEGEINVKSISDSLISQEKRDLTSGESLRRHKRNTSNGHHYHSDPSGSVKMRLMNADVMSQNVHTERTESQTKLEMLEPTTASESDREINTHSERRELSSEIQVNTTHDKQSVNLALTMPQGHNASLLDKKLPITQPTGQQTLLKSHDGSEPNGQTLKTTLCHGLIHRLGSVTYCLWRNYRYKAQRKHIYNETPATQGQQDSGDNKPHTWKPKDSNNRVTVTPIPSQPDQTDVTAISTSEEPGLAGDTSGALIVKTADELRGGGKVLTILRSHSLLMDGFLICRGLVSRETLSLKRCVVRMKQKKNVNN